MENNHLHGVFLLPVCRERLRAAMPLVLVSRKQRGNGRLLFAAWKACILDISRDVIQVLDRTNF